jgi:hypothetical protein
MVKKQIRGLLDYTSVNNDEDWEFAPLSEEYMIGMGLGASREATRWAFKGYMLELHQTWASYKKKGGQEKEVRIWKHRLSKSNAHLGLFEQNEPKS